MRSGKDIDIVRVRDGEREDASDTVVAEEPLDIFINENKHVTLMYTPPMMLELAVGHLYSEGVIDGREDVLSLTLKPGRVFVEVAGGPPADAPARVVTSGCGAGPASAYAMDLKRIKKVSGRFKISPATVSELAGEFRKKSRLFEETGGVHSAALSDGKTITAFADDVGRHNAADKVMGKLLLEGKRPSGAVFLTTGRVSSEIMIKCARAGIPVIVSRGAPTALAVRLAERFGITLLGFVRGKRMNVYTHAGRIVCI